jgi:cell division septum initiation protein DivIVA
LPADGGAASGKQKLTERPTEEAWREHMSIRDQEAPEFSHALRGYDRVQVDEYLAGFREYVIQLEDRAAAAELAVLECRRELASPGSGGISQRLAAILQLANEEADEIRARAHAEGEATTQQATSEAERTVHDASEQRDAIQREIDDLSAVREGLLQRLVELGDQIRGATARYEGYPPGTAPTARGEVELFDVEAVEQQDAANAEPIADVAADAEPIADAAADAEPIADADAEPIADDEAETQMITSTTPTPGQ